MALPKKRTSKSRTRRRFSQYAYKQRGKLERFVDQLTSINKPFIFDKDSSNAVTTIKVDDKPTEEKKSKLKVEKVDKIENKKDSVKKVDKAVDTKKKEAKKEVKEDAKTEDKGKWFNNLFTKKDDSSASMKNLNKGGSKKMFRRKAT